MKQLTVERLRELVTYEGSTGFLYWLPRTEPANQCASWNARNAGARVGSMTPTGYLASCIDRERYQVHRLVWLYCFGSHPSEILDHINGVRDDNRIENLRLAPMTVNGKNQAMRCTNTSGVMGVTWAKTKRRWVAQITVDRKNIVLGRFEDIEDAAACRRAAERRYGFHPNHGRAA